MRAVRGWGRKMFILDPFTVQSLTANKNDFVAKALEAGENANVSFVNSDAAQTAANMMQGKAISSFGEAAAAAKEATNLYTQANAETDPAKKNQLLSEAMRKNLEAQTKKGEATEAQREAERFALIAKDHKEKGKEYNDLKGDYDKKAKELEPKIQEAQKALEEMEKANILPKREGTFAPGTTDPTTGLTKQPGETDEEFQKRIKKALGQPDKGLGAGTGSAGGLVSAARSLLRNIALNALRTISNNPIVMLAKNLFNRSLAQTAVSLLEAAQIEEVLGSGIKQQIILLLAQAKTIDGESASNIEYWKQAIQENKQLARATHELAKGAA